MRAVTVPAPAVAAATVHQVVHTTGVNYDAVGAIVAGIGLLMALAAALFRVVVIPNLRSATATQITAATAPILDRLDKIAGALDGTGRRVAYLEGLADGRNGKTARNE